MRRPLAAYLALVITVALAAWTLSAAGAGGWKDTPFSGAIITAACPFGEPIPEGDIDADALTNGEEATIGTNPCQADTDSDGCSDGEEVGPSKETGGQRDPLNHWDFYDVDETKKIDGVDIGFVRSHFNQATGHPQYSAVFDRSPGSAVWAPAAPNGVINAIDIALVRASFNHSCQALS